MCTFHRFSSFVAATGVWSFKMRPGPGGCFLQRGQIHGKSIEEARSRTHATRQARRAARPIQMNGAYGVCGVFFCFLPFSNKKKARPRSPRVGDLARLDIYLLCIGYRQRHDARSGRTTASYCCIGLRLAQIDTA